MIKALSHSRHHGIDTVVLDRGQESPHAPQKCPVFAKIVSRYERFCPIADGFARTGASRAGQITTLGPIAGRHRTRPRRLGP